MDTKSIRTRRLSASLLLSLFLLMGITLGAHTLSHDHARHVTSNVVHESDHANPDGLILPSGTLCVLSAFVHSSFETTTPFTLPEPSSILIGEVASLYSAPFSNHSGDFFSLRAPPVGEPFVA